MKTSLKYAAFLIFTFSVLGLPGRAQAQLVPGDLEISQIIRVDPTTCAIELSILDSGLNLGVQDGLQIDGESAVQLQNLVSGLLSSLLNLDLLADQSLLLASPDFELLTGVESDIPLDAADCEKLQPDAVVEFVSGLLGDDVVDALTLPDGFDDLTALVRDPLTGVLSLLNLGEEQLDVSNNDGDTGQVGDDQPSILPGNETGGDNTAGGGGGLEALSGGCSFVPQAGQASMTLWLVFLGGIVSLLSKVVGVRILGK